MNFIIAVYHAPLSSRTHGFCPAFEFTKAVISEGHHILQVFFYRQGVLNAHQLIPQVTPWGLLNISLKLCSSACQAYHLKTKDILPGFTLSTLTQFFRDLLVADRYIVFTD